LYDPNTKKEKVILGTESEFVSGFYGVTWNKDFLYVSKKGSILKIDEDFCVEELYKIDMKRDVIHQIVCYDDKIYITNTEYGAVDIFDLKTRNSKKIELCPEKKNGSDHFNSIFKRDEFFYTYHHNRSNPSFARKYDKDFSLIDEYLSVGSQGHNVYVEDNIMYSLDSRHSRINIYDTIKKKMVGPIVVNFNGGSYFLRGFAKTKDNFYIGSTTHTSSGGKDRDTSPGWIVRYDNSMKYVDFFEYSRKGQIREIRVISEIDYAHNNIGFLYDF